MELATSLLSRVLEMRVMLKMIPRLQFEARKVLRGGSGLDPDNYNLVNLMDLARATGSVASLSNPPSSTCSTGC